MPLLPDKVLVVENDPANLDVFRRVLERAGFEVVTAEDGRMALAEVGQHSFAAIVCDVKMPALGGLGVYAVLEELFPDLASRVIFVTAFASDPSLLESLQRSGRPLLVKPIDIADLVDAVRRVVASHDGGASEPSTS
jgi:CheY-like chemotaxis protein